MRTGILFPALAVACLAQPLPTPSGSWAGAILLPTGGLEIQITLAEGTPWTGRISIPSQGLKNFDLLAAVDGERVTLRMAGIPGDPRLDGVLKDGAITGTFTQGGQAFPFSLKPGVPPQAALAAPAGLREREVKVGQGAWTLPGTLTLPAGKGPFPAVVLVHGSGAHDRDETIGESAPFRDLAWGLAQRGVAVLRYEKRTQAHPAACLAAPGFTIREEAVEDAALAAAAAAEQPEINRVYVLGHSMGGYLLPRLAKAAPRCAGFISLAGNARPIEELLLEQMRRQGPSAALTAVEAEVKRLKALDPANPGTARVLNGPPSYWLDLRGYAPAHEAQAVAAPMLFLQGDKDCQVTLEDFGIWKAALGGRKNATFKRYARLNHLFMPVEGVSTGAEYAVPGQHVSPEVLDDLAAWIGSKNSN